MAMTPAMATRRFWPPDSSKGLRWRMLSSRPVKAAASFTRRSISASSRPMFSGPKAMSLAQVSSKSWYSGYWNTSPTRKRKDRRSLPSAHISLPSTMIFPEVGRLRPLKWPMRVDLPLPVEPMMPTKSPSSMEKLTSSRAAVSSGMPGL